MLALILRSASAAGSGAPAATLIELFHPVAVACGAVLVATGVTSLVLRVDHIADLLRSTYGAVLAVKLAFTLGVGILGLHHARRGAQLVRLGGAHSVARSIAVETILAGMVIATSAVLVGTAPPMSMVMPITENARSTRESPFVGGTLRLTDGDLRGRSAQRRSPLISASIPRGTR